jgi:hypothetical protein
LKCKKSCILVSPFKFKNCIRLLVLTMGDNYPNQVIHAWLVDLHTISTKYGMETWTLSPNDDIRKCLLDIQRSWTKNAIWNLNSKKWTKWCIFVSLLLFNNIYGLPVHTIGITCPNQLFYLWLFDLQIICAKYRLKTWLPPNDETCKYLPDMQRSWNQNAFWDVNNKKWRKRCKFVSPFLFNNTYCSPALTMHTKIPNHLFYVWLDDLQTISAK